MIKHAAQIESYFGYWPLFCDAKIINFSLAEYGVLILALRYSDADKNISAEINIKFSEVSQMELSELRTENVIDELRIPEKLPGQVVLEACFGVHGKFICSAVEVLSITPNLSFQRTTFGGR